MSVVRGALCALCLVAMAPVAQANVKTSASTGMLPADFSNEVLQLKQFSGDPNRLERIEIKLIGSFMTVTSATGLGDGSEVGGQGIAKLSFNIGDISEVLDLEDAFEPGPGPVPNGETVDFKASASGETTLIISDSSAFAPFLGAEMLQVLVSSDVDTLITVFGPSVSFVTGKTAAGAAKINYVTPVPAALPLLASALIPLGWYARRRRANRTDS